MKAYIKTKNWNSSVVNTTLKEDVEEGYLTEIEVAEIGEILFRKHLKIAGFNNIAGTARSEAYYEYEPVTHRVEPSWQADQITIETLKKENAYLRRTIKDGADATQKVIDQGIQLRDLNNTCRRLRDDNERFANSLKQERKENASLLHQINTLSNQIATGNAACERIEKENYWLLEDKELLFSSTQSLSGTIENKNAEIERLRKENADLRRVGDELDGLLQKAQRQIAELKEEVKKTANFYKNDWIMSTQTINFLKGKIEQLKKAQAVKWEKANWNGDYQVSKSPDEITVCGYGMMATIPLPPAEKDEADESWEEFSKAMTFGSSQAKYEYERKWKEGYRDAKKEGK